MPENFMMIKFPSRGGYTSLTLNFQNMFASVIYFSRLILMYFLGKVFLRSYLHEGCVGRVMLRLRAGKELMDRPAWGLKDWADSDLLGKTALGAVVGSQTPQLDLDVKELHSEVRCYLITRRGFLFSWRCESTSSEETVPGQSGGKEHWCWRLCGVAFQMDSCFQSSYWERGRGKMY